MRAPNFQTMRSIDLLQIDQDLRGALATVDNDAARQVAADLQRICRTELVARYRQGALAQVTVRS